MILEVSDIQFGCTHDGPGLRTVVFLKGCPLHCRWCHNPENIPTGKDYFFRPERCMGCGACEAVCPAGVHLLSHGEHLLRRELCRHCMGCAGVCPPKAIVPVSREMSIGQIIEEVKKDAPFYRRRGGLTVSGGEPTLQFRGLLALLKAAKENNIHTCVETCGVFPPERAAELARYTDLFLYDIKDTDAGRLKENTGGDLEQILGNLLRLDALGAETVVRCVLIPGVNLDTSHAEAVAEIYRELAHCRHVELLPYHPFGISKAEQLGLTAVRYPESTAGEIRDFAAALYDRGIPVKLSGTLYEP